MREVTSSIQQNVGIILEKGPSAACINFQCRNSLLDTPRRRRPWGRRLRTRDASRYHSRHLQHDRPWPDWHSRLSPLLPPPVNAADELDAPFPHAVDAVAHRFL